MDEFDDLSTYNGDIEHNMWVDFTTNQYTGELADVFDDPEVDNLLISSMTEINDE